MRLEQNHDLFVPEVPRSAAMVVLIVHQPQPSSESHRKCPSFHDQRFTRKAPKTPPPCMDEGQSLGQHGRDVNISGGVATLHAGRGLDFQLTVRDGSLQWNPRPRPVLISFFFILDTSQQKTNYGLLCIQDWNL